jgi:hypothetical protein
VDALLSTMLASLEGKKRDFFRLQTRLAPRPELHDFFVWAAFLRQPRFESLPMCPPPQETLGALWDLELYHPRWQH